MTDSDAAAAAGRMTILLPVPHKKMIIIIGGLSLGGGTAAVTVWRWWYFLGLFAVWLLFFRSRATKYLWAECGGPRTISSHVYKNIIGLHSSN